MHYEGSAVTGSGPLAIEAYLLIICRFICPYLLDLETIIANASKTLDLILISPDKMG